MNKKHAVLLASYAAKKIGPELTKSNRKNKEPGTKSAGSSSPSAMANSALAPISTHHTTVEPIELFLKEKTFSLTGDDAKVKDANGNTVFKIKAELLTFSQRRTLVDADGNTIAQLRHKKLDIIPTVYIGTLSNETKVSLKKKGIFNPFNCDASISVDGRKVGKVSGNWRAKKFSIEIDGAVVATIGRKRTVASTFMGADSYRISVKPQGEPIDLAFMTLLTIALDELYHD